MRLPRAYRPSTVGHAIGRRRADRSGSGVAPAQIGREAGIWDRDSLWFLVVARRMATFSLKAKEARERGLGDEVVK